MALHCGLESADAALRVWVIIFGGDEVRFENDGDISSLFPAASIYLNAPRIPLGLCQGIKGSRHQAIKGSSDQGVKGSRDQGMQGSRDRGIKGSMDEGIKGSRDQAGPRLGEVRRRNAIFAPSRRTRRR